MRQKCAVCLERLATRFVLILVDNEQGKKLVASEGSFSLWDHLDAPPPPPPRLPETPLNLTGQQFLSRARAQSPMVDPIWHWTGSTVAAIPPTSHLLTVAAAVMPPILCSHDSSQALAKLTKSQTMTSGARSLVPPPASCVLFSLARLEFKSACQEMR